MADFKEMVGHRLKVLRVDARMSQEELAQRSGVSVAAIGNYEQGKGGPLLETACALAEALGCTPNDLCGYGPQGRGDAA